MNNPRRLNARELFDLNRSTPLNQTLVEAIRQYPVTRIVEHCSKEIDVSPFDVYAVCPMCGVKLKVRTFAAVPEIEDVFDAVFEWLLMPEAQAAYRRRQEQIAADLEGEEP